MEDDEEQLQLEAPEPRSRSNSATGLAQTAEGASALRAKIEDEIGEQMSGVLNVKGKQRYVEMDMTTHQFLLYKGATKAGGAKQHIPLWECKVSMKESEEVAFVVHHLDVLTGKSKHSYEMKSGSDEDTYKWYSTSKRAITLAHALTRMRVDALWDATFGDKESVGVEEFKGAFESWCEEEQHDSDAEPVDVEVMLNVLAMMQSSLRVIYKNTLYQYDHLFGSMTRSHAQLQHLDHMFISNLSTDECESHLHKAEVGCFIIHSVVYSPSHPDPLHRVRHHCAPPNTCAQLFITWKSKKGTVTIPVYRNYVTDELYEDDVLSPQKSLIRFVSARPFLRTPYVKVLSAVNRSIESYWKASFPNRPVDLISKVGRSALQETPSVTWNEFVESINGIIDGRLSDDDVLGLRYLFSTLPFKSDGEFSAAVRSSFSAGRASLISTVNVNQMRIFFSAFGPLDEIDIHCLVMTTHMYVGRMSDSECAHLLSNSDVGTFALRLVRFVDLHDSDCRYAYFGPAGTQAALQAVYMDARGRVQRDFLYRDPLLKRFFWASNNRDRYRQPLDAISGHKGLKVPATFRISAFDIWRMRQTEERSIVNLSFDEE